MRIHITVLLTGLMFACAVIDTGADTSAEREHRHRLDTVQKQISSVQQDINSHRGEHRRQEQALQEIEQAIAAVHQNLKQLEQHGQTLATELDEFAQEEAKLFNAIAIQRAQIGRDIASAYRLGQEEPLKLLLNQEEPHELSRSLKYYEYYLEARQQRVRRFQSTLDELADVKQSIADRQHALNEQQHAMASAESLLRDQLTQRQTALEALQQEIDQKGGHLAHLEHQQQELERLIQTIQEAITRLSPTEEQQPFAQRRGQLSWPAEGQLQHRFGNRRSASLNWDGWVIRAEEGKPVRAVHGGRVVFSDYLRGHGLLVIIDHGDEYLSLYAHNQGLLKEVGDWVSAGEVIARIGDSGGQEHTSLYFELRHRGRPTNPAPWFKNRG